MSKRMLLIISQIILLSGYCFGNSWVQTSDEDFVVGSSSNIVFSADDSARIDPIEIVSTKTEVLPTARLCASAAYSSSNDKIYVFGGEQAVSDILEYDPVSDTLIKKTSVLPTARFAVSAVYCSSDDKIYIFGGCDGEYLTDILEYDPETDTVFKKEGTLPTGRSRTSATYVTYNNKIYIFGGFNSGIRNSEIIEYNPETDSVIAVEETLPAPRCWT